MQVILLSGDKSEIFSSCSVILISTSLHGDVMSFIVFTSSSTASREHNQTNQKCSAQIIFQINLWSSSETPPHPFLEPVHGSVDIRSSPVRVSREDHS